MASRLTLIYKDSKQKAYKAFCFLRGCNKLLYETYTKGLFNMPKTTAIRLTSKNIDLISETLNISKKDIENDYMDRVLRSTNPESIYFVKDVLYMGTLMPYLVYGHQGFLDDFASVPPGIEDRFVPVTQVKD